MPPQKRLIRKPATDLLGRTNVGLEHKLFDQLVRFLTLVHRHRFRLSVLVQRKRQLDRLQCQSAILKPPPALVSGQRGQIQDVLLDFLRGVVCNRDTVGQRLTPDHALCIVIGELGAGPRLGAIRGKLRGRWKTRLACLPYNGLAEPGIQHKTFRIHLPNDRKRQPNNTQNHVSQSTNADTCHFPQLFLLVLSWV